MAEVVKLSDSQQPQNASRSFFSKKKMLVGPPTEHTSRNPVQLLQKGGKKIISAHHDTSITNKMQIILHLS